jgi:hypothetical protein
MAHAPAAFRVNRNMNHPVLVQDRLLRCGMAAGFLLAALWVRPATVPSEEGRDKQPGEPGAYRTPASHFGSRPSDFQPKALPLSGAWRFELDRADTGVAERWFERTLTQTIQLPGALQNQGFGDEVTAQTRWTGDVGADRWRTRPEYAKYREPGNVKVPFFLQPERHYVGAAWYQRDFELPTAWQTQRVVLTLERAHWETHVWLDGRSLGTNTSLATPHLYDLGTGLKPGRHTLTVRVDNRVRIEVGDWAHSVTDHTQGNWNGLIGRLGLTATTPVWIDDAQVFPHLATQSATVKVRIGNATGKAGAGSLSMGSRTHAITWDTGGCTAQIEVPLGDQAQPWDEFTPNLQRLTIQLTGAQANDERVVRFGFREITAKGRQFFLNGREAFFRGTLECCIFPLTGFPPTDVESWKRVIRICQAHGLNHIRFHSWCPPEAAFEAADQLGFYYQVECGVWTTPGNGQSVDPWIYEETERIVRAYGNHPSFLLLTHGNEPHGPHHEAFLARWVNEWKQRDPRRLYTSGSAYPQLPDNQYHVYHGPRGPGGWLGKDYRQSIENLAVPVIVHEMGQWCVYPNFAEIPKYTGPLKPKNFEIFRESLAEHGMLDQWPDFLRASGKLQVLCYKEEIEAALRTPGIGGFQLLDLHDFPGQGTALVGVLDPFWEEKGYISPAQFHRFCGPTVPLARLSRRVFTQADETTVHFEVAHFGPAPLRDVWPVFKLLGDNGRIYQAGNSGVRDIEIGNGQALCDWKLVFKDLPAPARYKLVFGLAGQPSDRGMVCENDWDVWVYPARLPDAPPLGVLSVNDLTDDALARLQAGGKVLWLLPPGRVAPDPKLGKVELGFSSIFWNTAWTRRQPPHTLGIFCDPKHPLFSAFPTDYHSNWQWWYLISQAGAMILDDLPAELRPTVQVIDDWFTARKLGLVFETKVGPGRLLVCSIDLNRNLNSNPVLRQFRHSLFQYMAGDRFQPKTKAAPECLRRLAVNRS